MTINRCEKGKRGEREFSAFLRDHGFNDARRGQQYSGIGGEDVIGIPAYHVEVKRVERLNIHDAMNQSIRDADNQIPIVAHRKNRTAWLVTMRAEDFLEMVKE